MDVGLIDALNEGIVVEAVAALIPAIRLMGFCVLDHPLIKVAQVIMVSRRLESRSRNLIQNDRCLFPRSGKHGPKAHVCKTI